MKTCSTRSLANSNDARSSRPQLGLQLFSPVRRYIVGKYTIAEPSGNKPRFPEEKLTSGNIRGVGERVKSRIN